MVAAGKEPSFEQISSAADERAGKSSRAGRIPERSSPFDYIFLMRPMILIPVWTFFLLGAHHAAISHQATVNTARLIEGFVSFTLLLGSVYIVNQITDRESDLANDKLFLLSHGIVSTRNAKIESALLTAVSFAVAAILLPPRFMIVLALSAMLGAAYSIRPARFKARPVLDVASNAVGNGILNTLAGWVLVYPHLDGWLLLIPYPFAVAGVHLATTLADIRGDREKSLKTSGTVLGERKGIIVSTILMAVATVLAYIVNNRLAFYASLFSLPFFLVPSSARNNVSIGRLSLVPVKAATLIFSISAGTVFRSYLLFIVIAMFLTKIYYSKRFAMKYPL